MRLWWIGLLVAAAACGDAEPVEVEPEQFLTGGPVRWWCNEDDGTLRIEVQLESNGPIGCTCAGAPARIDGVWRGVLRCDAEASKQWQMQCQGNGSAYLSESLILHSAPGDATHCLY